MSEAPAMQDDFLEALMGDFLDESTGLLATLNEKLLALDSWAKWEAATAKGPPVDMLNEMFRAAHSLKGLSGMLRLNQINILTHKVENVFDAARNALLPVTTDCIDVIFPAIDCISAMIDALRSSDGEMVDSRDVVEKIEGLLAKNNAAVVMGNQKDVERELAALQAATDAAEKTADPQVSIEVGEADPLAAIIDDMDIPNQYLSIYLDEAPLTLEEITEQLLTSDGASVENLLILCHRLKGSSAAIGLHRPAKLAHLMEDYLQDLRRSARILPAGCGDLFLECVDALRDYFNSLKMGGGQDKLGDAARRVATRIAQSIIPRVAETIGASSNTGPSESAQRHLRIQECLSAAPLLAAGHAGYVRFEKKLQLADCKAQLLFNKLDQLGNVFFRWISESSKSAVRTGALSDHGLELVFGVVTDADASEVKRFVTVEGVEAFELTSINVARPNQLDQECKAPAFGQDGGEQSAVQQVNPAASAVPAANGSGNTASEMKSKPAETLRVDIERLDQLMNLAGQLVINRARFGQISEGLKNLVSFRSISQSLSSVQHYAARISQTLSEDKRPGVDSTEALSDLATKMRADLELLQRDVAQLTKIRTEVASLSDAVHQLDRVSDGIQSTVMDTRMVPIGPLFTRFKRVIRDLTRDNHKDIRLEIIGENTELDKRMIDELGDPLIHLIRNSVDHGVEAAEVRVAAGKPAQGVVSLNSFHRGNHIVIEVSDDGKGLDINRIRSKAIAKGLVSDAEAESMTPQQIQALIWRPGFSTAESITEVSGRGMGMDIVWSKIEALNGLIEVSSETGKGCTFTIKLPLTMAILPSLLSVIGAEVYAIPVESVTEIVRVRGSDLSSVQGKTVLRVRGRVIALVELDEVFEGVNAPSYQSSLPQRESITVVIVGADSREIAIVVDSLIGEQDVVIQSLAENFQNVDGLAGASILGDGRISLILDVPTLLDRTSQLARNLSSLGSECEPLLTLN
jgi:two-component system, chemotaxis family, sensor kinase CheA